MAYFEDLSFFSYTESPWVFENNFPFVLLNVGWLDENIEFKKGDIPDRENLLWKLSEFCKRGCPSNRSK